MEENNLLLCTDLSKIIKDCPEFLKNALKYVENHPVPWNKEKNDSHTSKKFKSNSMDRIFVLEAVLQFLETYTTFCRLRWKWSTFFRETMECNSEYVKWLGCRCISIVLHMSENQYHNLIDIFIPSKADQEAAFVNYVRKLSKGSFSISEYPVLFWNEDKDFYTIEQVVPNESRITERNPLVNLNIQSCDAVLGSYLSIVEIAISTGKPLCLIGPVGCGKTTLVHYAASNFGGVELLQVQLGEELDSKLLLGSYHCTDIPGEFLWQPGILTRAVMEGRWLLMEDIDLATSDVVSVLICLVERNFLSVPGYRDNIIPSPGFQLFFTQRTIGGVQGYFQHKSSLLDALRKHWMQLDMRKLSRDELSDLLQKQFPELSTISQRILDVFLLFSSDCTSQNNVFHVELPDDIREVLRTNSRLVSIRDLIKWCQRIKIIYEPGNQDCTLNIVQDAIDIFCNHISAEDVRLTLACELTTRLGVVRNKAEYFCRNYKPIITTDGCIYKIGRCVLPVKIKAIEDPTSASISQKTRYAMTRVSSCLMESIACCIRMNEPVLLVGETGTGKTTTLQLLAKNTGNKLVVLNMNQQSDTADLLGGYKPAALKHIIGPVRNEFETLFRKLYNVQRNIKFLNHISNCFNSGHWSMLTELMKHTQKCSVKRLVENDPEKDLSSWISLGAKIEKIQCQLKHGHVFAFTFIEGALVRALQEGYWVLLDEINLATPETLQCLSGILEGSSVSLYERGDVKPIKQHPNFRLVAAMNPATDVGKKQLPQSIRNRFSEFFVNELTSRIDLNILISCYLPELSTVRVDALAKFYLRAKREATATLTDGTGHRPHYSLRTLCRALSVASQNLCGSLQRSLYEGLCLSFLTQLDSSSHAVMNEFIMKTIIGEENKKVLLNQPISEPEPVNSRIFINGYWISKGPLEIVRTKKYILTPHIKMNLVDLLRIVSLSNHPALIQGDTSVGKTSLITYLAAISGNRCLRINNHEHTDLQEYTGAYSVDSSDGQLIFKEGLLAEALRNGYWIILDELNLAPSEVLEALNRVLDDNRELYIPEIQTVIKAHPNFRLFATQNPPGLYGGRKMLSRAFRNRFIELHFSEIPAPELEIILQKKCDIPASYASKMVAVMKDLQSHRRESATFAGKQGFITLRDLFRWGERYRLANDIHGKTFYDWDQHIAEEGFLVLAGRMRRREEAAVVLQILEKRFKRKIDLQSLFTLSDETSPVTRHILETFTMNPVSGFEHFVWTYNMRVLAVLVGKALEFYEPVLMVGETGCGKTSLCQLIAALRGQKLFVINCHQHSESSDFLGGLRPVRNRTEKDGNLKLFEWVDGPLIDAMKSGDLFLADEISLADDSVLERLNSLLEPERTLLLNEKPNCESNFGRITAHEQFHFLSTMNPGSDFGKKELSPALRNRLTEIWCESYTSREDLISIIENNLNSAVCTSDGSKAIGVGTAILNFVEWFQKQQFINRFIYSIRDLLLWSTFINVTFPKIPLYRSYVEGASIVFLDKIGISDTITINFSKDVHIEHVKLLAKKYLMKQIESLDKNAPTSIDMSSAVIKMKNSKIGIEPFFIEKGELETKVSLSHYEFSAYTTFENLKRLLKALQVPGRAVLLEGNPGVGKTSLVEALAKISGHPLVRINLSEQTDISDLFGADLPVDGAIGGTFAWKDGPFLKALKDGHWILLDELNLASQSVLEGLNAVLDHRGELFIPELGRSFRIKSHNTKLFGCQNPAVQGGARKRLPKSFLNRFIQVYVEKFKEEDLLHIVKNIYSDIPLDLLRLMVRFNCELALKCGIDSIFFGAPWEMNLRDLSRWCQVLITFRRNKQCYNPGRFVELIYIDRMRAVKDKEQVKLLYKSIFGEKYPLQSSTAWFYANKDYVILQDAVIRRAFVSADDKSNRFEYSDIPSLTDVRNSKFVLHHQKNVLRSLAICVNMNWLSILVGGSCSGKVSVVKTLAQLCNKRLEILSMNSAMDSMDIIGAFEQIDYNRHLDKIASEAEQCLYVISKELFFSLKTEACQVVSHLFAVWENYRDFLLNDNATKSSTVLTSEMDLLKNRIVALNTLLSALNDTGVFKENILELKKKLAVLQHQILDAEDINSGGRFEWVDSTLVKCISEGSWLLVENVNLCSPAVLDRLNGLLEPNGVLTIGEKGVDGDGNLVTVRPHPNFRLFFTMDPSRGEISRAMRNRGVEIALPSVEIIEECNFDTQSVLHSLGILPFNLKSVLVNFHRTMKTQQLGDYDKIKYSHLRRVAFLISYRIRRGYSYYDAFRVSCEDVYVKSRYLSSDDKIAVMSAVTDIIKMQVEPMLTPLRVNWNDTLTPTFNSTNTLYVQWNSSWQAVRQDADVFPLLFRLLITNSQVNFNALMDLLEFAVVEQRHFSDFAVDNLSLLHYYLYHFYAISSRLDANLRHSWFCTILNQFFDNDRSTDKIFIDKLTNLSKLLRDIISQLASIVVNADRKCTSNAEICEQLLPWDVERLPKELINETVAHERFNYSVQSRINFILFGQWPAIEYNSAVVDSVHFRDCMTIREYCRRSEAEIIKQSELVNHRVLRKYVFVADKTEKFFKEIFSLTAVNVAFFPRVLKALLFYKHFQDLGNLKLLYFTKVDAIIVNSYGLECLDIHFHWFTKHVLNVLVQLAEQSTDNATKNLKEEVLETVSSVYRCVPYANLPLALLAEKIRKQMGSFTPALLDDRLFLLFNNYKYWDPIFFEQTNEEYISLTKMPFLIEIDDFRNKMVALYDRIWTSNEKKVDYLFILDDGALETDDLTDLGRLPISTKNSDECAHSYPIELINIFSPLCHRLESRLRLYLYASDIVCDSTDSAFANNDKQLLSSLSSLVFDLKYKSPLYTSLLNMFLSGSESVNDCDSIRMLLFVELTKQLQSGSWVSPLRNCYRTGDFFPYSNNYLERICYDADTVKSLPMLDASLTVAFNGQFLIRSEKSSESVIYKPSLSRSSLYKKMLNQLKLYFWRNSSTIAGTNLKYWNTEYEVVKRQYLNFVHSLAGVLKFTFSVNKATSHDSDNFVTVKDIGQLMEAVKIFLKKKRPLYIKNTEKDERIDLERSILVTINDLQNELVSTNQLIRRIQSSHYEDNKKIVAEIWVSLGLSQLDIFLSVPHFDLRKKSWCKSKIAQSEVQRLQHMISAEYIHNIVTRNCTKYPFEDVLLNVINELKNTSENISENNGNTIFDNSYRQFLKEVRDYFDEKKRTYMKQLSVKLSKELENQHPVTMHEKRRLFEEVDTWLYSHNSFVAKIMYPSILQFGNISIPLLYASSQYAYGLRILRSLLEKSVLAGPNELLSIKDQLLTFSVFPLMNLNSFFAPMQLYLNGSLEKLVEHTKKSIDNCKFDFICHFKILKISLIEFDTISSVIKYPNCEWKNISWKLLHRIIQQLCNNWLSKKISDDNKKLMSECLFIRKPAEHSVCIDDDITDDIEIDKLFSYNEDGLVLEDKDDEDKQSIMPTCSAVDKGSDDLLDLGYSADQAELISRLHFNVIQSSSTFLWYNSLLSRSQEEYLIANIETSFVDRYQLFDTLFSHCSFLFDAEQDNQLIPSLVMMAHQIGNQLQNSRTYNLYTDANVSEAIRLLQLLDKIKLKLNDVMSEWERHPLLLTISTIVDRLMKFEVISPFVKFVEGSSMLLNAIEEWDKVAHSGISFLEYRLQLQSLITEWRKVQISHWEKTFEYVDNRIKKTNSHYWFYLYYLCSSFIQSTDNEISFEEIVLAFHRFIETSDLVSFSDRLNMLLAFHCHFMNMSKSNKLITLCNVLWNIRSYYLIFANQVHEYHKEIATPVYKELSNYIKIIRWSDKNFFAVKNTIEKTLRTISKYIKKYEKLSQTQVCSVIKQISFAKIQQDSASLQEFISSVQLSIYVINLNDSLDEYQQDQLKFLKKSGKLCKNLVENGYRRDLLLNIDNFILDLSENIEVLNKLEVDNKVEKEKQRSEAKNILQRKKKAFSDLFKELSNMGLSYKAGLIGGNEDAENYYVNFASLLPLDIAKAFEILKNRDADTVLTEAWKQCNDYFYMCVSHQLFLKKALQKPHNDVSLIYLDRMKGFTNHLTQIVFGERKSLWENMKHLYVLRAVQNILAQITSFQFHSYKSDLLSYKKNLSDVIKKSIYYLHQFSTLLETLPEHTTETNYLTSFNDVTLKNNTSVQHSLLYKLKSSSEFSESKRKIVDSISLLAELELKLSNDFVFEYSLCESKIFDVNEDLFKDVITDNQCDLLTSTSCNTLKTVSKYLSDVIGSIFIGFERNPLCDGLVEIQSEINELISQASKNKIFSDQVEGNDNSVSEDVDVSAKNQIMSVYRKILLVFQNLYKKSDSKRADDEQKEENAVSDGDQFIKKNCLKNDLVKTLNEDIDMLKFGYVIEETSRLVETAKMWNSATFADCRSWLMTLIFVMNQYLLLAEYMLTEQICSFKLSTKLCLLLIDIFTELSTKGFNIPEEYMENEQAGNNSDSKGGMGLSDEKGIKDVSDQIESQDQLEDAQLPGQERKEQEDDCEEENNGIEMSDDFGGKSFDLEKEEPNDESDSENEDENDNFDKEMGETGQDAETLDDKVWGDSDEEESSDKNDMEETDKNGANNKSKDKQYGAKDERTNEDGEDNPDNNDMDTKEEKEINELDEQPVENEQIDPYHGNQPPLPEPEDFDLPEDMQLDDGDAKDGDDGNSEEENPFDIDTMKAQIPPNKEESAADDISPEIDNEQDGNDEKMENDEKESASDEPNEEVQDGGTKDDEKVGDDPKKEESKNDTDDNHAVGSDDKPSENISESAQNMSDGSKDAVSNEDIKAEENKIEEVDSNYEDDTTGAEQHGVGKAEQSNESNKGHSANEEKGSTNKKDEVAAPKKRKNRPGESDDNRTLDFDNLAKKRLKTVDAEKSTEENSEDAANENNMDEESSTNADLFQHIKDSKSSDTTETLDAATENQTEQQSLPNKEDEPAEPLTDDKMDLSEEDEREKEYDEDMSQLPDDMKSLGSDQKKKENSKRPNTDTVEDEMSAQVNIEGEIVPTLTVQRGFDSLFYTSLDANIDDNSSRLEGRDVEELKSTVRNQISALSENTTYEEAQTTWSSICGAVESLSQELTEQLRLILEPTQASRLKGDFRTGRRINMRKVIPYIASQFRKDKIWLRRTKPSKRDYQIILAIDNSSSMNDNRSKQLAFESVAVVSKAIGTIEAGQLAVVSFGKAARIVHRLSDPFTLESGIRLLQGFSFEEEETRISDLMKLAMGIFLNEGKSGSSSSRDKPAQLLIIISDGRGVTSEGVDTVNRVVNESKQCDIFVVFIIVDNPDVQDSIFDIKIPVFENGQLTGFNTYIDNFPFPYYMVLRDISKLPAVLSDALRQWFELVSASSQY